MSCEIMFSKIWKIKIKNKLQQKYVKNVKIIKIKVKKYEIITKKCFSFCWYQKQVGKKTCKTIGKYIIRRFLNNHKNVYITTLK